MIMLMTLAWIHLTLFTVFSISNSVENFQIVWGSMTYFVKTPFFTDAIQKNIQDKEFKKKTYI